MQGLVGHLGQRDRGEGASRHVAAAVGEADQRLDDPRDAVGELLDLGGGLQHLRVVGVVAQVLGQRGDAGDRVADLVGHPGGQLADGGEPRGVHQLVLQPLHLAVVLHQHHGAAADVLVGGELGLVQAQVARRAVEEHRLLVEVVVMLEEHAPQQVVPGRGQAVAAGADHAVAVDAGELGEGVVPHQQLVVDAEGAQAHRQPGEDAAVVAAQAVELPGEAGQPGAVGLQAALDEVDVVGGLQAAAAIGQVAVDDVLGHRGAHQPREVGLDAIAQAAQRVGAPVQRREAQVGQRPVDLAAGDLLAEGAGQVVLELLAVAGDQRQALGPDHRVHRAGLRRGALAVGGGREQRDQDEGEDVGRQRDDRHHVPVRLAGQGLEAGRQQHLGREVGEQRHPAAGEPHQHAGRQPADHALAVGPRPVEQGQQAGQALGHADEGGQPQGREVVVHPHQAIEEPAGEDHRADQGAPQPAQPVVEVRLVHRGVGDQHQVVEDHPRERQRDDDHGAAGGGEAGDEHHPLQPQRLREPVGQVGAAQPRGIGAQALGGPQDQRHRQRHQQQEQRQGPAGLQQGVARAGLGEHQVEDVRHHQAGEEQQQQRAPVGGVGLHHARLVRLAGPLEPGLDAGRAVEDREQGEGPEAQHGGQLDQRGERQHRQQAVVAAVDAPAPDEQHVEQCQQQAEGQRQGGRRGGAGHQVDGVAHGLHLQRQQRQHRQQADQGDQAADPARAVAEGEEVGQGGQLVGAHHALDRHQQHRRQQEGAGHPQVVGQVAVAGGGGQLQAAVDRPGAGVDAQRQGSRPADGG